MTVVHFFSGRDFFPCFILANGTFNVMNDCKITPSLCLNNNQRIQRKECHSSALIISIRLSDNYKVTMKEMRIKKYILSFKIIQLLQGDQLKKMHVPNKHSRFACVTFFFF